MILSRLTIFTRRLFFLALPLAFCLVLLTPAVSEAHAVLIKSDPANNAVLSTVPAQVRMWFSEDLNPATSSAYVVNPANQHVNVGNSLVLPTNVREMDLALPPDLPPANYVVIWRTQSAADGHVLSGSFLFGIAGPDGTVPRASGTLPGQNNITASNGGQFDIATIISFLMITLADLATIFWVGAQLWRAFVLELSETQSKDQRAVEERTEERFVRHFSLPTLRILLLANIGILLGQALSVTGNRWDQIFSPSLLAGLIIDGHFGTFWLMRIVVTILAMAVGTYMIMTRKRSQFVNEAIPWINLILGLALLIAVTLSGHAAAASGNVAVYAILVDWLHLLAASLWIGGMMYLSVIYLPTIKASPLVERTRSLLTTLPRFSPLAITGVVIMAISGPFNATIHMTSLDQLITTAYGRTLIIKSLLVGGMLLVSAIHVFLLRPRLKKDYMRYSEVLDKEQAMLKQEEPEHKEIIARQVQRMEGQVAEQTGRLSRILRWEPTIGIAVLICTGLLNVFAGTLQPTTLPPSTQQPGQAVQATAYTTTVKTTDNQFTATVNITPNSFGPNTFTVTVMDSNGAVDTNVGVSLYTTMLDMDMGTDTLNLQPDGKGHFTLNGNLGMAGHWMIRIEIRTPDNGLHQARFRMVNHP